jgi:hypothetical protein
MAHFYPVQRIGDFGLILALSHKFLHEKYGVEMGQRYHQDIALRVKTTMEIDRAVYEEYGTIGLGFEDPYPRVTIEPFGHRFIAAMYGCECEFKEDADVWVKHPVFREDIDAFEPWTLERFEACEPVKQIIAQARYLREHYDVKALRQSEGFLPHFRILSSVPNLGSVVNNGLAIMGNDVLLEYLTEPNLVQKLYANITQLMLLCLEYFPTIDAEPLQDIVIGNCSVAMISPKNYVDLNFPYDLQLVKLAKEIGANLVLHQDSGVTPHLTNYARLGYVQAIDFGQDTDWEKAAQLFPDTEATCILFPAWLQDHSMDDVQEELLRIMTTARAFQSFSFGIYDIDTFLGEKKIFEFYDVFRMCSERKKCIDKFT